MCIIGNYIVDRSEVRTGKDQIFQSCLNLRPAKKQNLLTYSGIFREKNLALGTFKNYRLFSKGKFL